MGRPTASKLNKEFAVAFAQTVTCNTGNGGDIVARCGDCSVFALLCATCPDIVRNNKSIPRDGITEVEMNKVLQV